MAKAIALFLLGLGASVAEDNCESVGDECSALQAHSSKTHVDLHASTTSKDEYKKFGTGGCSTAEETHPKGVIETTGISRSACQALCDKETWSYCRAYEYCGDSNCDGNCKVFADAIASTNGYPGVTCYVREGEYLQVGTGGCSTSADKYPKEIKEESGITSSACQDLCDKTASCGAYEYCSGSNCDEKCKLFGSDVSSSNGYPGVSCFQKKYLQVGTGGCSTSADKYPKEIKEESGITSSACQDLCDKTASCGAYEYCSGSNCDEKCKLFGSDVSSSNGYPGVSCFRKQAR